MRPLPILLAALVLLGSQPAFSAAKETYAHCMEMGQLLYFNGDVDRSIKKFERAGELNPKAFEPHLNLVNLWVQKGGDDGLEKAQAECQEVLKLKPGNKDVHLILGNLLRTQASTISDTEKMNAKLSEAQKEISAAEELGANPALCENMLGMILLQKGETDKSLEHIEAAIKKQPVFPDAHLVRAVLLFKKMGVDKVPEADKAKHLNEHKKQLDEVLEELDIAAKQKDKNAEAHNTKADILYAAGRHEEAGEAYKKATEAEPRYAQAWAGIGNVEAAKHSKNGNAEHLNKARDAYDKAKKLRPNDKNLIYGLAVMLEKQGALSEAIQEFNSGLMLETDPQMKMQILMHLQQLQQAGGFRVNPLGSVGTGGGGNNIFTQGLSVPFSQMIKLKEPPKDKANQ